MDPITATLGSITAAQFAAGAGVAGAGISAVGAIRQGEATAATANYQAQVSKNNEVANTQNAQYAREAAVAQTEVAGLKSRARQGAVIAGIAANNLDVNSGSAKEIRETEAETGDLSQLTTAHNALLQAYGYQIHATSDSAQAILEKATAAQAVPGATLSAGGSLLSAAPQLALRWRALTSGPGGSNLDNLAA